MVNPPPKKVASQKGAKEAQASDSEDNADRRKHLRVDLPLKARFLTEAGDERAGVVLNISAGGAMLRAKHPPAFGQSVVLYIDQIGRVEGKVVRSSQNCFAVTYQKRRAKSAKIADHLTTALNQRRRGTDRRMTPRVNHDTTATVYLEDGREFQCAILDISLTGASIEISPRPPLGMHLILGRMTAKVVRRHEKGVGVVFIGGKERMDEVLAETTAPEPFDGSGPGFAPSFGKKGVGA
jgi:c-di-GMP-binding flagellar brake protein YcgR